MNPISRNFYFVLNPTQHYDELAMLLDFALIIYGQKFKAFHFLSLSDLCTFVLATWMVAGENFPDSGLGVT